MDPRRADVYGPDGWAADRAAGRALSFGAAREAAAEILTSITDAAPGASPASGVLGPLSPREQEVIRLIAEGMSDRQIGDALYISHRTVMRHVANILAKLEVSSRGAASAWYTRQVISD